MTEERRIRDLHKAVRECDCGFWNAQDGKLEWPHPLCGHYRCAAMVRGMAGKPKPWEDKSNG